MKPILNITQEEFNQKHFMREVTNDTCDFNGDWSKLDFEGKSWHIEKGWNIGMKWLELHHKSIPAFIDGDNKWAYLHVPYRWEEDMTITRIYPLWDVATKYRTSLHKIVTISWVKAIDADNKWYWLIGINGKIPTDLTPQNIRKTLHTIKPDPKFKEKSLKEITEKLNDKV
jgi:hypothetical protein